MPSLNKLRTHGGWIITIIIFIAVIAFLLGDILGAGGSVFQSRKFRVGTIDGHHVGYEEFRSEAEYITSIYKLMWGTDNISSRQQDQMYEMAWEQLIMKYSYEPSFKKLGLNISDEEQVDMINGVYLSPVYINFFTNPMTGVFDEQMMREFLSGVNGNPQAQAIWKFFNEQALMERNMSKYMALINGGFYATAPEVEKGTAASNNTYDARFASRSYNSIPDSVINVKSADIKKYYENNKKQFRQEELRNIEYVVFSLQPSGEDYAEADKYINEIAEEFRTSANPMQYATFVSQEKPDQRYYGEAQLPSNLAAIAFGRNSEAVMYGPQLSGDTYTISRVADRKIMPDSLGAKHILLGAGEQQLADSLVWVIRGGSDFTALAMEYSNDQSVMNNGGDLGRFAPEEMITEFSDAVIDSRVGQVFTVNSQYGLHVVKTTYQSMPVQKAQIATIKYKVDPSNATLQEVYGRASNFLTSANKDVNKFQERVNEESLSKRMARLTAKDRTISGLQNSRELVRWAFNEKATTVSDIMEIDGDYVVAAITQVGKKGYATLEDAAPGIKSTLIREAKAALLASEMRGKSLEEVVASAGAGAEIETADNIQPSSFYIPGVGMELKLLGAVTAAPEGQISKPVDGNSGVYLFEVTGRNITATTTPAAEKITLEANVKNGIEARTMQALSEESDITDMRVKFF